MLFRSSFSLILLDADVASCLAAANEANATCKSNAESTAQQTKDQAEYEHTRCVLNANSAWNTCNSRCFSTCSNLDCLSVCWDICDFNYASDSQACDRTRDEKIAEADRQLSLSREACDATLADAQQACILAGD